MIAMVGSLVAYGITRLFIHIYDIVSLPVYIVIDWPFAKWLRIASVRSERVTTGEPTWTCRQTFDCPPIAEKTFSQVLATLGAKFGDKKCLGYRRVLEAKTVTTSQGREIVKKRLDDKYTWRTYRDVDQEIGFLMNGLVVHGVKPGDRVCLILETRQEWIMTEIALMRLGATVVTMFSNSGIDGCLFVVNEVECTHVITNIKVAEDLISASATVPRLTTLIVVQDAFDAALTSQSSRKLTIVPYSVLLSDGRSANNNSRNISDVSAAVNQVTEDDIALIMYTSGTSGIPKGVMYSQRVMMNALKLGWALFSDRIPMESSDTATTMSYLPLAHIFEYSIEHFLLTTGGNMGYASPLTAFKNGIGLMEGTLSDCESLNPTSTAAVPLVLERMKAMILQEVQKKPLVLQHLFRFAVSYKSFWNRKGFATPLTDKLMFAKTSTIFGKRLQCLCLGGAAVSLDTHRFMRCCLNTCISQGLGATETFATASAQDRYNYDSTIGYPWPGIKFSIRDWDEGGYRVTDKPHPRGELLIGGPHIALGYFKREEETAECFIQDPDDPDYRWFVTGDIVSVDSLGAFKIVDRKAALVKLMNGEFIALGKIEALLKTCSLIENVFVAGSSLTNFLVAIVVPNAVQLLALAKKLDPSLANCKLSDLCANPTITTKVREAMRLAAKTGKDKLKEIEIPKKIVLVDDEWTPDNGLITASLKIRRKQLQLKYSAVLDEMFGITACE